jgi:hypothetical protein
MTLRPSGPSGAEAGRDGKRASGLFLGDRNGIVLILLFDWLFRFALVLDPRAFLISVPSKGCPLVHAAKSAFAPDVPDVATLNLLHYDTLTQA